MPFPRTNAGIEGGKWCFKCWIKSADIISEKRCLGGSVKAESRNMSNRAGHYPYKKENAHWTRGSLQKSLEQGEGRAKETWRVNPGKGLHLEGDNKEGRKGEVVQKTAQANSQVPFKKNREINIAYNVRS